MISWYKTKKKVRFKLFQATFSKVTIVRHLIMSLYFVRCKPSEVTWMLGKKKNLYSKVEFWAKISTFSFLPLRYGCQYQPPWSIIKNCVRHFLSEALCEVFLISKIEYLEWPMILWRSNTEPFSFVGKTRFVHFRKMKTNNIGVVKGFIF